MDKEIQKLQSILDDRWELMEMNPGQMYRNGMKGILFIELKILMEQALQKRDEETLAKVKSLVMGYDTKDGYSQLYDQVIEHVYDQLLSTLTTK